MTDSRKLTDNELEQVAGGARGYTPDLALDGTPSVSFSVGNYVKSGVAFSDFETVYRINALDGNNATATMYEKNLDGSVITTTDQTILLGSDWIKLDPQPGWVPAN